ncbi:MAG: hypothetical protein O3A20_05800 [Planctomycetota bacterium]|nr:hypothetical protein [Planctomycetota bacterium]
MKHRLLLSLIAVGALSASPLSAQSTFGSAQAEAAPERPCEAMARAAYAAARSDAETEFWMSVALAVNEPGAQLAARLKQAWITRREAWAEAIVQYEARLQVCEALGHGAYLPVLSPGQFTAQVNATFYPLPIGATYLYEAQTAHGLERIETTALDRVLQVGGVPCRTVSSNEYLDGTLKERTFEWFSQDLDGSVWYLGEITQEFEAGLPTGMDGSWRAGVDNAKAGLQVPAVPERGDVFRMEFLLGTAEDVARVVDINQTVTVPAGSFDGCAVVQEWSPLDVRELVLKYYAPNVGMVLEVNQRTGDRLELIEIR